MSFDETPLPPTPRTKVLPGSPGLGLLTLAHRGGVTPATPAYWGPVLVESMLPRSSSGHTQHPAEREEISGQLPVGHTCGCLCPARVPGRTHPSGNGRDLTGPSAALGAQFIFSLHIGSCMSPQLLKASVACDPTPSYTFLVPCTPHNKSHLRVSSTCWGTLRRGIGCSQGCEDATGLEMAVVLIGPKRQMARCVIRQPQRTLVFEQ